MATFICTKCPHQTVFKISDYLAEKYGDGLKVTSGNTSVYNLYCEKCHAQVEWIHKKALETLGVPPQISVLYDDTNDLRVEFELPPFKHQ